VFGRWLLTEQATWLLMMQHRQYFVYSHLHTIMSIIRARGV